MSSSGRVWPDRKLTRPLEASRKLARGVWSAFSVYTASQLITTGTMRPPLLVTVTVAVGDVMSTSVRGEGVETVNTPPGLSLDGIVTSSTLYM